MTATTRRSRRPTAGDWAGQRRYDRATQALRDARERLDVYRAALDAERSALPSLIREGLDAGLSSLPVTGREHAASRVLATAALTTPLVIWLATTLPLFQLESLPGGPVVTGIGMGMAVFLVSMVVIAFQYKYSSPKARSIFVYAMVASVVVLRIATWFEGSPTALLTPAVIVTGALVSLIGAMATGRYVLRTIVRLAPVYDGEND